VWKIAGIALLCVNSSRIERPSISEVLKEIEGAIMIEERALEGGVQSIDIVSRKPSVNHPKFRIYYSTSNESTNSLSDTFAKPGLR
jgi:hypothetical protein